MQLADSLLEILEQRYPEVFFLIRFADQGIELWMKLELLGKNLYRS